MKLRVQYIKRQYKDKVYSYPFVVTSYRDKKGTPRNKVVLNLSHLPEHAVEALRVALLSEGSVDSVPIDTIEYLDSLPFGGIWAVWSVMKDIGIVDALERITENHRGPIIASIADRVINPKPYSKRALCDAFENCSLKRILGVDERIPLGQWYEALESLYGVRMDMFSADTKRIYLYDITSTYFEGTCCPLASWGYNRDGKKGKMIIVVGLLTTSEGRPVAVRVFPGNTSDQATVIDQVKELREEFGVEEIIFVGDRGMITSKRIAELDCDDFSWARYITALKRQEMMRLIEDSKHPVQLTLFDHMNLVEVSYEGKRYVLCHDPARKEEDKKTRFRLLEKTEEKLRSIENNVKSGRLKKKDKIARRLYRWINKWNMEKFFTVEYHEGFFHFSRNDSEIERYSVLDGCYVIASNVKKEGLSTEGLHEKYKDLKHVEAAFRSMKVSDLFMRPVRHWNEARVRGHIFICMLAYLVVWEAKKRLGPIFKEAPQAANTTTLRELWDTLNRITIGRLRIAGKEYEQISSLSKKQRKILKLLRAPIGKKAKEA